MVDVEPADIKIKNQKYQRTKLYEYWRTDTGC